ncbi:chemotaxis-specific protein-glutamate methyltransferase CheB [Bacteriovoracaceae bacterium]|nr:chemotaxis-specific protein-glutamate methyltransferase CheB [Bacteriovoracaceae bacterium]
MSKFSKILMVDDSLVFRTILKNCIRQLDIAEQAFTAVNGRSALDIFENHPDIDLIICDLEMPVMDGVTFVKKLREINKETPVLILSNQSIGGVNLTFKALEIGANEFISKTDASITDPEEQEKELKLKLSNFFKPLLRNQKDNSQKKEVVKGSINPQFGKKKKYDLICIGSSTGGPEALKNVVSKLDSKINIPIIIVQHMPAVFTTVLASNLNKVCPLEVCEAKNGQVLEKGHVYIAPGDHHLTVSFKDNKYVFSLNQNEKVCYVRPSVNVTIESLLHYYSDNMALFILTGMGDDGKDGCIKAKEKGSTVLIQDEASSVVWGMPGAVYKNECYDEVLDLDNIGYTINKIAG